MQCIYLNVKHFILNLYLFKRQSCVTNCERQEEQGSSCTELVVKVEEGHPTM